MYGLPILQICRCRSYSEAAGSKQQLNRKYLPLASALTCANWLSVEHHVPLLPPERETRRGSWFCRIYYIVRVCTVCQFCRSVAIAVTQKQQPASNSRTGNVFPSPRLQICSIIAPPERQAKERCSLFTKAPRAPVDGSSYHRPVELVYHSKISMF